MAFSQLRSSEVAYRAGGLAIVQQTVRKVSDPAALEEMIKDLAALMTGNQFARFCVANVNAKLTLLT
jgi:uncharacterized phosphosugar-binding protein